MFGIKRIGNQHQQTHDDCRYEYAQRGEYHNWNSLFPQLVQTYVDGPCKKQKIKDGLPAAIRLTETGIAISITPIVEGSFK
jgi:hypothetical protein